MIPARQVLERAICLALEYCQFDTTIPSLDNPIPWSSLAAPAATYRVQSISWELSPLEFVKINFDGSVRDGRGSASFVIRGPDARLLPAGGSHLFLNLLSRIWSFISSG